MTTANSNLKKTPLADIVDNYDNFFFDCDGVLYNGSVYLKETYDALHKLQKMGKNIYFVTNTSRNSRRDTVERIRRGGFEPEYEKVYTSSSLAAKYISVNYPGIKKVYLVGLWGIKEELQAEGITVLGSDQDNEKPMDLAKFDHIDVDEEIGAVVVGVDYGFNFYKLSYASVLIQKGALFIASNYDNDVKMKSFNMPAAGCMVKAIEFATGKNAHIVGKPNADVIDIATKTFGLDKKRSLIIGDRYDSDVLCGKRAGIDTYLVLTGVTSEEELMKEVEKEDGIVPDFYWEKVEL